MSEELPEGWVCCRLDVLFSVQSGGTPSRKVKAYFDGGLIPWVKTGDFANSEITKTEECITERAIRESNAKLFPPGTLLIAMYGEGKTRGQIGLLEIPAATNQACAALVSPVLGRETKRYIFYYLLGQYELLRRESVGGNQPNLNLGVIKAWNVSLAPLDEQRRIVAQAEALLARARSCQERLDKTPAILKRFRQSVLAAACTGTLTADWRKEHPAASHGSEVVRQIDAVRTNSAQSTNGRVEVLVEEDWPAESIPETWTWVRFGSVIGELRNGVSPRPNIDPPGTPVLRISATRPGAVDLSDTRYLPNGEAFASTFALRDGDLLFTRYNGSIELLGVCGMVRGLGQRTMLYPDKLMRVRFDHAFVLPSYAEVFFQNHNAHDRMVAKSKSSAGQNGISGSDVKAQAFAVPPVAEQCEIVRRVEALVRLADRLEARYAKAKAQVDKITQAVLAKAFRGELVPAEAELARREGRSYETAAELLARIASNREAQEDGTRGRNAATKKRVRA